MAGSFGHCNEKGKFRFDLIENMGDAHEACEMMHYMIITLTGGKKRRIRDAEAAYFQALRTGTVPTLSEAGADRVERELASR